MILKPPKMHRSPSSAAPAPARHSRRLAFAARALTWSLALLAGLTWVAALDGLSVLIRGGARSITLPIYVTTLLGGCALGLIGALCAEGLRLCALGLNRLWPQRGPLRAHKPPPSRWIAALCAPTLALLLHEAHTTFTAHELGATLMTGYAVLLGFCVGLAYDHFRIVWTTTLRRLDATQRGRWRAWALRAALLVPTLGGAAALHHVNSHYFIGLYQPLHQALTGAAIVWGAAGAAWALAGLRVRHLSALFLVPLLSALLLWPAARWQDARAGVYFFGTELRHLTQLWEPLFDRDGDGILAAFGGGDCDDHDPQVHPLAFERPENGVDDNCRLGDRVGPAQPPVRATHPRAAQAVHTWRTQHQRPNVLMLFVDTWRADYLSPEHTPHLWQFSQGAVRFTQARTTAPRTPMAWMSLIRGRFLGRCLSCRHRLSSPGVDQLISRMGARGYRTMGRLVGSSWKRYHAAEGYTRLLQKNHVAQVTSPSVTNDALTMLRSTTEPFFLVAHYTDAHAPQVEHEEYPAHDDSLKARYASELRFMDHHIGRLFKELKKTGRDQKTIVVVFADHGENLGEHGDAGGHHGVSLFDEVVHIPLLMAVPGVEPAEVHDEVSIVDIAPTLLDLVGASPLPRPDGRSLAGHFFGHPPPKAPVLSEFYDFGHRLRAVTFEGHKLIEDSYHGVRLLFDLRADPREQRDLYAQRPEVAAELQRWLDTWIEHAADPTEPRPERCQNLVP